MHLWLVDRLFHILVKVVWKLGEFMDEIEVENHILQMAQDDKNLYLLTMKYLKDDGQASIKIVDKESFKVIDTVENIGKFMNSTDMLFLDDKIYVLKGT